jgi:RNA polymerase sigma-54 factor
MAISPRLEMRQGQALVMTPQLMQAIKLLQMSNLDLVAYVDQELERNPLLERADAAPPEPAAASDGGWDGGDGAAEASPSEGDWAATDLAPTAKAIEERLGTEVGNLFPEDSMPDRAAPAEAPSADSLAGPHWQGVGAGGSRADEDYNPEAFVAAERSLHDYLAEQLQVALKGDRDRLVGQYIIDLIDEAGWLTTPIETIAETLGARVAEIERVLKVVQTFDPPGVGARHLRECLAIQLRERDRYDPAMQALITHLELLAKHDYATLRKVCGVDEEDLAEMIAEVKRLSPKPGLVFGSTPVQPVVPDVMVRAASDGGWAIELNHETLPKVLISQTYFAHVAKTATKETEKAYLAEQMQTANWLVKSLDQRAKTILKVSAEIVRQQDSFLAYGVEHLRPLNLRTVADAIGMHESTVSRVTSNKYLGTPRGTFELKYFFTAAIASAEGGEAHSAEAVRHRIKVLIDAEKPDDVLSDDAIVDILKKGGIDIARRTVAKYREALRIPSSVERRRAKQAMAGR